MTVTDIFSSASELIDCHVSELLPEIYNKIVFSTITKLVQFEKIVRFLSNYCYSFFSKTISVWLTLIDIVA